MQVAVACRAVEMIGTSCTEDFPQQVVFDLAVLSQRLNISSTTS